MKKTGGLLDAPQMSRRCSIRLVVFWVDLNLNLRWRSAAVMFLVVMLVAQAHSHTHWLTDISARPFPSLSLARHIFTDLLCHRVHKLSFSFSHTQIGMDYHQSSSCVSTNSLSARSISSQCGSPWAGVAVVAVESSRSCGGSVVALAIYFLKLSFESGSSSSRISSLCFAPHPRRRRRCTLPYSGVNLANLPAAAAAIFFFVHLFSSPSSSSLFVLMLIMASWWLLLRVCPLID